MGHSLLQPVSWQRMDDAVAKVRRRLLHASASLRAAGVPYAVVGGNAVAAWVSRVDEAAVRNTRDVDILLRREDLPRAIVAMTEAGYSHRNISSLGGGAMDVFLEGPEAKVRDAVHVLFAGEMVKPDALAVNASVDEAEEAGDFRLISLPALVRMKLAAWRDKDRMHLRDLAGVGLLDPALAAGLPPLLAERLEFLLANPDE
ncbi:MAG: hypothetical protein NTW21_39150 [Verrucomicrobia bacterium]|nr:hypothetical protein [Verrucomicrobiota bacterium]